MKRKVTVVTATRAEFGLLKPIITALKSIEEFETEVVVTGAHLSPEFGLTYREIQSEKIEITKKIEILLSSDTSIGISKSMGLAIISFAEYFDESRPDILLVLGDRYETLAVCCAAMNARIPIAHLYGGETTEGAIDEAIRHSITKMSYLHFTATEEYRSRVIQLGEHPDRVFTVGAMGVENAVRMHLLTKEELEESIRFSLDRPYAIVTFHPETLEKGSSQVQFEKVMKVLEKHRELKYIFTKANADADGRIINKMIDEFVIQNSDSVCFDSLGSLRYLSAVKYAYMVIGNSSSGLIEVPSFKIPTVNIGERQRGRIYADSVINCSVDENGIDKAIMLASSESFRNEVVNVKNPYGDGNTSMKVVSILRMFLEDGRIDLKKSFYDIKVGL